MSAGAVVSRTETAKSSSMSRRPKKSEKLSKDDLDEQVTESSKESFPASDPPAVGQPTREPPEGKRVDRKPPKLDKALVRRLAEKVGKEKAGKS
jgi:hypothetical protein